MRRIVIGLSVLAALYVGRNALYQEPVPEVAAENAGPGVTSTATDTDALRRRAWDAAIRFDSYLSVMAVDVGLARWAERTRDPLRIYIPSSELPGYTPDHRRAVLEAFGRWSRVGPNVIPVVFTFSRNPQNVDVVVEWESFLSDGKAGLATITEDRAGWIQSARLSLALGTADGRLFLPETTYTIALHEIGHLFGLGHSDNPRDVMYPTASVRDLSLRDRTTARLLYQIEPGPPIVGSR